MKNEDYLNSDDIEVATLYANIIYQEKGENYLQKVLENNKRYFFCRSFCTTNEIILQKAYEEIQGFSIKEGFKIESFTRKIYKIKKNV